MKRRMLKDSDGLIDSGYGEMIHVENIPGEISEYMAELKLLYSVPFAYLIPDETLLPTESMRFFYIDQTWVNALANGAASIGRNDNQAAKMDEFTLGPVMDGARSLTGCVRHKRVHENHRQMENGFHQECECPTGFMIRSVLTRKWKGLEVAGYDGQVALKILRCEMIAADILICVFDGILDRVTISEPRLGLRFGAYENSRQIEVKSIKEGPEFGRFMPGKKVNLKSDLNGRIDVLAIKDDLEKALDSHVTPSVFAFEMMLAAQKSAFTRKGVLQE